MARRADDSTTAYIVRNAPTDIVRGVPSPTPSRPIRRPSRKRPIAGERDDAVSTMPPPTPVGRKTSMPPPPLPPGMTGGKAPHIPSAPATPSESPRPIPTRSELRPARRDHRSDPEGQPVRVEHVRVPDYDAVGSATSMLPPPTSEGPADRARALVDDLCRSAPDDERIVLPRLLSLGEHALVALAERFPGPLWCDPRRPHARLPRGHQLSAISAAMVAFGKPATPYVVWLMASEDSDIRYLATVTARDLVCPEVLEALSRLLLHSDPTSRRIALDVLPDFEMLPEYARCLGDLRRAAESAATLQSWRVRAVQALCEARDPESVRAFVQLLTDKDRSVARAAHVALRTVTAHDFGTMRLPWTRWYRHNGSRPRSEWLVEGLADRRADLRALAVQELERTLGRPIRLPESASRGDLSRLQEKIRRALAEP